MLESRDVPSAVLMNGTLFVNLAGGGTQTLSVDAVGDKVVATENGRPSSFNAADVKFLSITGDKNDVNVIQNNTSVDMAAVGGNKGDTIFGGTGRNVIDAGKGDDVVYALLGNNTILAGGDGKDKVFTNFGATVDADKNDLVVRFFGPGRTPGTPFIGAEGGVLYITPSNNGSSVRLDSKGDATVVTYDLGDGLGTRVASFEGVKAVSYFGGAGNDTYINNTKLVEAAYGSAGNDTLVGGKGEYSLLKGSSGDDVLVGRADRNDLSGNAGRDVLFALGGKNVFRADANDLVVGAGRGDVFISP